MNQSMQQSNAGRGRTATADMKARIAAIRRRGADVLDVLWERNREAVSGKGYSYEFAPAPSPTDREGT